MFLKGDDAYDCSRHYFRNYINIANIQRLKKGDYLLWLTTIENGFQISQ